MSFVDEDAGGMICYFGACSSYLYQFYACLMSRKGVVGWLWLQRGLIMTGYPILTNTVSLV